MRTGAWTIGGIKYSLVHNTCKQPQKWQASRTLLLPRHNKVFECHQSLIRWLQAQGKAKGQQGNVS